MSPGVCVSFLEVSAKFHVNLHMCIILGRRYIETEQTYKGDWDPNLFKNYNSPSSLFFKQNNPNSPMNTLTHLLTNVYLELLCARYCSQHLGYSNEQNKQGSYPLGTYILSRRM